MNLFPSTSLLNQEIAYQILIKVYNTNGNNFLYFVQIWKMQVEDGRWRRQSFTPGWEDFNLQCINNYEIRVKLIGDEFNK